MTRSRFTVVTPVMNGATFVGQTIASVRAQSFEDWEYFVMDGGSKDDTVDVALAAARGDPRIRVVSERDRGMYDGVIRGFERGTGEVCYWINADDMLMPWAFDVVSSYMQKTGAEWVTGTPAFWDQRGRLKSVGIPRWYPRALLRAGLFHGKALGFLQQESTFFGRGVLERVPPRRVELIRAQRLAGDFMLWVELAKLTELHTIPTVLAGFRLHESNASHDQSGYFAEIARAGFHFPPRAVGKLMNTAFRPVGFAMARALARRRY